MTLILAIPYSTGIVLISDKKSSITDGDLNSIGESTTEKFFIDRRRRFAMLETGIGQTSQRLFHKVHEDDSINSSNIPKKLSSHIKAISSDYGNSLPTFLLVTIIREQVKLFHVNSNFATQRELTDDFFSEGSGKANINLHIRRIRINTPNFFSNHAEQFGIALINYVAPLNDTVGRVFEYGVDIIKIDKNGTISKKSIRPDNASKESIFKCVCKLNKDKRIMLD
ncbi:MAG: hypothetical protein ABH828_02080 [archaeon]